jgi:hypothetical protein
MVSVIDAFLDPPGNMLRFTQPWQAVPELASTGFPCCPSAYSASPRPGGGAVVPWHGQGIANSAARYRVVI